jgi:hypothetical protein
LKGFENEKDFENKDIVLFQSMNYKDLREIEIETEIQ